MPILLSHIERTLNTLLDEMTSSIRCYKSALSDIHPSQVRGAKNLLEYLVFRAEDRNELQRQLSFLGLSSLGRSEAAIRPKVEQVKKLVGMLNGREFDHQALLIHDRVDERLAINAKSDKLFGPQCSGLRTRIMVTMPREAALNESIVENFLKAGMNIARVNCAHDNPSVWSKIVKVIREKSATLEIPCKVLMDLAGPKFRTGQMPDGPQVVRAKPKKDARGQVISAVRVVFYPQAEDPPAISDGVSIPLELRGFDRLSALDRVSINDARGKKRHFKVVKQSSNFIEVLCDATTFFESGLALDLFYDDKLVQTRIARFSNPDKFIQLNIGDLLRLVAADTKASSAVIDEDGVIVEPANVPCCSQTAFREVSVGDRVKFDDGKFSAIVVEKNLESLVVHVTHAPLSGGKLRSEKGVNFPDSVFSIKGLTENDVRDLDVVTKLADMIALSFVNTGEDVKHLQAELGKRDASDLGIILKIETPYGFERLPEILLQAMHTEKVGVMIARGDLGVEAGWRKLVEIQEEILWICASGHIPVIWATQVLDSYAKIGVPTRSEITDAAMAQRAECIMLNKGPYMHKVIRLLNRIIKTMDDRQYKRTAKLSKLRLQQPNEVRSF